MFYIVYKTTNKLNSKIYVGVHKTNDLDDDYLGSGLHLGRAIEKYGKENFEKEILGVFDKASDMFQMESEIVNEEFVEREDTYNLKLGGNGGWDYTNSTYKNLYYDNNGVCLNGKNGSLEKGRETQKILREFDPMWIKRVSENISNSLKKYYENGGVNPFKNKKHTEETKRKIGEASSKHQLGSGNSQFGKIWICNIELKKNQKIDQNSAVPVGWVKGRNKWNDDFHYKAKLNDYHVKLWREELEKNKRENEKLEETMKYWKTFKEGEYDSIREFCRKVYPKSHVTFTKYLKKFVPEYNLAQQGKRFKSKI